MTKTTFAPDKVLVSIGACIWRMELVSQTDNPQIDEKDLIVSLPFAGPLPILSKW